MLGRKIINPVEKKVLQIIDEYEVMGRISNRLFSGIRNREAVVNTLTRAGFTPNDPIKPKIWSKAGMESQSTGRKTRKKVVRIDSVRGMLISKMQKERRLLIEELSVDKKLVTAAMYQMRRDGHEIETILVGGKAVGYQLAA